MRPLTLAELTRTDDPAWPAVRQWLADAPRPCVVLPVERPRGEATLVALQAPLQTTLGAVARYTGGILVDHGWLRLLGAGGDRLVEGLREWNGLDGLGERAMPGAMVVAHDALGGFYVVNGGALGEPAGTVHYRSPRAPGWMDLGLGYTRFVGLALAGELDPLYVGLRWRGWEEVVRDTPSDHGVAFGPALWQEPDTGRVPLECRRRVHAPLRLLWAVLEETERGVVVPEA